jgi:hypothetical protein
MDALKSAIWEVMGGVVSPWAVVSGLGAMLLLWFFIARPRRSDLDE